MMETVIHLTCTAIYHSLAEVLVVSLSQQLHITTIFMTTTSSSTVLDKIKIAFLSILPQNPLRFP